MIQMQMWCGWWVGGEVDCLHIGMYVACSGVGLKEEGRGDYAGR